MRRRDDTLRCVHKSLWTTLVNSCGIRAVYPYNPYVCPLFIFIPVHSFRYVTFSSCTIRRMRGSELTTTEDVFRFTLCSRIFRYEKAISIVFWTVFKSDSDWRTSYLFSVAIVIVAHTNVMKRYVSWRTYYILFAT